MTQSWKARYGRVAMVTGASSGIGEQFARQLAQKGFDLLLTARRQQLLDALGAQLQQEFGVTVTTLSCDLGDLDAVHRLCERAQAMDVGLVVSNAGYGVPKGDYLAQDLDAMEAMYRTNSLAPARIARLLLPAMVEKRRGGMIFTGSMEGDAVFPHSAAYAASKAFLHSLVLAIGHEVSGSGVDVLLLAPGSTDTEAPLKQGISRDQLIGVMDPADVARQALAKLGKQPHFMPGLVNRTFIRLLRLLPWSPAVHMAGYGMRQAIEKSNVERRE